ncbi:MAG: hypothetical protein Edafosvirus36_2 [Edafosvirus sp.]|uniref:Uncharacterized protein n=1 Tax=Edafosvirus sp. TaxID=2487765 RepID=A0A3G4ZV84_9VIRU|nr:MAG: hypothetical protein Edafosvirus36_2 [Edafosvirus sp.]
MSSYIGPITNSLIDGLIKEFKKKEIKDKIMNNVVDPLLSDLTARYYPYIILTAVVFVIIIALLVAILILVIVRGNKC